MSGVKLFVVKLFYRLSFVTVLRFETVKKEHKFIKIISQLCKKNVTLYCLSSTVRLITILFHRIPRFTIK